MKPWMVVAIVAGLGALLWFRGCEGNAQGALKERIKALEHVNDSLATEQTRVDTVKIAAKAVYLPAKAQWDSVTVVLGDKIKLDPVLLIADSAIKACSLVVTSCEAQVTIRDSRIATMTSEIVLLKKRKGSRFGCVGGVAGIAKGVGPGAACGLKLF